MNRTIGDNPGLRKMILDMGTRITPENPSGQCRHQVLEFVGEQDLTGLLGMQQKCPNGLFLATCKNCGTTKSFQPFKFSSLQ